MGLNRLRISYILIMTFQLSLPFKMRRRYQIILLLRNIHQPTFIIFIYDLIVPIHFRLMITIMLFQLKTLYCRSIIKHAWWFAKPFIFFGNSSVWYVAVQSFLFLSAHTGQSTYRDITLLSNSRSLRRYITINFSIKLFCIVLLILRFISIYHF